MTTDLRISDLVERWQSTRSHEFCPPALKQDQHLDPLRRRADFRKLLEELAKAPAASR